MNIRQRRTKKNHRMVILLHYLVNAFFAIVTNASNCFGSLIANSDNILREQLVHALFYKLIFLFRSNLLHV
jgi:hypothetical protein